MSTVLTSTRLSLLLRIRDTNDAEAWTKFVHVYGPLVHRFGVRRGLQEADALDLVQEVPREIAKCIGRFEYDPGIGRFRSWLFTVARYSLNRLQTVRRRQVTASGDTGMLQRLHQQVDDRQTPKNFWEEEYQQRLFEWAAEQVQPQVTPKTWQAFWRTAVEGQAPDAVAAALEMKVASVYVAKHRVLNRLRNAIREIDGE